MRIIINKYYPFQVWSTSLVLSPVLLLVFGMISSPFLDTGGAHYSSLWEIDILAVIWFIFMATVIGCPLSLPLLLVYYGIFSILNRSGMINKYSEFLLKLLLSLIAITGMCITFYCFMGSEFFDKSNSLIPADYALGILLSGLFFKIKMDTIDDMDLLKCSTSGNSERTTD